jgi:hypothetical protein
VESVKFSISFVSSTKDVMMNATTISPLLRLFSPLISDGREFGMGRKGDGGNFREQEKWRSGNPAPAPPLEDGQIALNRVY